MVVLDTQHIVSISGGSASAVAADRVITRYGSDSVTLWFADTLWEDQGLYRFLEDLENRWDKKIVRHTDGRTPPEVASDASMIPNPLAAPCSHELKQKPFMRFIKGQPKPLAVYLGLSWDEEHRMQKPREVYEAVPGVTVDFPLLWEPLPRMSYTITISEWGIKPPRLYEAGFSHNNCGGRCFRQGIREWLRLKRVMPGRFEEVSEWEQAQRAKGGPRANRAIQRDRRGGALKPLTLEQIGEREDSDQIAMFPGDSYGCLCEY